MSRVEATGAAAPDGTAALLIRGGSGVSAAVKPPGEDFAEVQYLGGYVAFTSTGAPKLSIAPNGRALIVWATAHHVHAAVRDPGARAFRQLGSIRVYPDDPHAVAVASIAGAIGADGSVYLAWGAVDTGHLAVWAPGATGFTTVASIKSPGGSNAYAPNVALAAAGSGGTVGLVTVGAGGGRLEVNLTRWSTAAGASTELLEAFDNVTGGDVERARGVEWLHGFSGERATFVWVSATVTKEMKVGGTATVADEFRQLELPADGPFVRPTLPVGFSSTDAQGPITTAMTSETAGAGEAAILIVPRRERGEIDHRLLISRRADAGTPFGQPTNPLGSTLLSTEYVTIAPRGGGRYVAGVRTGDDAPRFLEIGADGSGTALQELPKDWPEQQRGVPTPIGAGNGDVLLAWPAEQKGSQNDRLTVSYDDATPPTISAAPASVSRDGTATKVAFTATAADRWTPTSVRWDFGDGTTATGSAVEHRFSGTGAVRVTATATDAGGNTAQVELRAASPDALRELVGQPATSSGGAGSVVAAPAAKLSRVSLSRSRFTATAGKVRARRGTNVRFTLSAASKVRLQVSRLVAGRRTAGRCVTRRAASKKGKPCTARRAVGERTVDGKSGANTVAFSGKLGRRLLSPGRYELRLTPVASAGAKPTSIPVRFTIVR